LSFLVDPDRSANPASYEQDLLAFWKFASSWAFSELGLHRLFTETYVFREEHIALLERAGMQREGVLKDHIKTENGYVDSLMHGLYSSREEGS
jgi:RimJ/RimL family protein N-acetyltransferase